MLRNLLGVFCLVVIVLWWLGVAVCLGPVMFWDWLSGCINRKFDELFKDF